MNFPTELQLTHNQWSFFRTDKKIISVKNGAEYQWDDISCLFPKEATKEAIIIREEGFVIPELITMCKRGDFELQFGSKSEICGTGHDYTKFIPDQFHYSTFARVNDIWEYNM
ncbi:MAG: hypothetical protein KAS12_01775 [Candidatus Aenigmarchaeota archaeon]|nr:hypothetical protein [Candidatus Aenigmarchaeota archaeon]